MSKDFIIQATPPSRFYIVSMTGVALAGTIGLPFMLWLIFTNIFLHNWLMVGLVLFCGLICAGMLLMWKTVRSALRQRRDRSLHEIRIDGQKFVYRRDDLVQEVPLIDILGVRDRVEAVRREPTLERGDRLQKGGRDHVPVLDQLGGFC